MNPWHLHHASNLPIGAIQALEVICTSEFSFGNSQEWDESDHAYLLNLIRGLRPQDTTETVLAVQFITLHLKGMKSLASPSPNCESHGMMMLRLSNQVLDTLQKYRGKGQVINVNYNVSARRDAVLNTLIATDGGQPKKGG